MISFEQIINKEFTPLEIQQLSTAFDVNPAQTDISEIDISLTTTRINDYAEARKRGYAGAFRIVLGASGFPDTYINYLSIEALNKYLHENHSSRNDKKT